VENMDAMFSESQFTGELSQWDVSNVTESEDMFAEAQLAEKHYPLAMQSN